MNGYHRYWRGRRFESGSPPYMVPFRSYNLPAVGRQDTVIRFTWFESKRDHLRGRPVAVICLMGRW